MHDAELDSAALRTAALRSERIRIISILAVLGLLFLFTLGRRLVFGGLAGVRTFETLTAYFGTMAGYEAFMLWRVTRALRGQADLNAGRWVINVIVEALFPTAGIALLVSTGVVGAYAALVAPVVLTYFLFVSLSTLRLNPALARLSGVSAAAGYGAVALHVFARYPVPDLGSEMRPVEFYMGNTIVILAAGLVAGELARQIRRHVAAALREARHVERMRGELEAARSIQQGLLPQQAPHVPGYDVAGWNQPADQTGGDYFGWETLPDRRVAFVLADVTGHGIGAALVAAACHAYTRAAVTEGSDLGAVLGRVNGLLCNDLPPGKLVTFVAAALDPSRNLGERLSAGHGPLLVYTASDDRVRGFDAHGIPFGIVATIPYGPPQEVHLEPGDMLVLLTDGFFEWENALQEEFGFERLHETIRTAGALPAAKVISTLHEAVTRFAGGTRQMDDLTALVVRRTA